MAQGGHRKVGLVIAGNLLELTRVQDLVDRDFAAQAADELYIADITYIPTWASFLCRHRRLEPTRGRLGDGLASAQRVGARCPQHGISTTTPRGRDPPDQGCQYTAIAFGQRCKQARVRPSMGSVGDCYDNAMCESSFATLECELLKQQRFTSQAEARMAVFDFIEGRYNPHR